jgi:hypothetical protein
MVDRILESQYVHFGPYAVANGQRKGLGLAAAPTLARIWSTALHF